MRKTVSIVSPWAQKTLSLAPRGLSMQVKYHFFSDPGPGNDQRPAGNLFANKDTSVALAMHSRSLSVDPQMMSLNRHEDNTSLKLRWVAHFVHELIDFLRRAAMW